MLADLRILVVEDDSFQRSVITRTLRRLGATYVLEAQDGVTALAAIGNCVGRIDILVLDLAMPGMDGVELLQKLSPANRPAAVILNSTFDADFLSGIELMAQGYDANVLGVVTKPLTGLKLGRLVSLYRASVALQAGP